MSRFKSWILAARQFCAQVLKNFRGRHADSLAAPESNATESTNAQSVAPKARRNALDQDSSILWLQRGDLLGTLLDYYQCMRRLPSVAPEMADDFSRIGCIIPPRWAAPDTMVRGPMFAMGVVAMASPKLNRNGSENLKPAFVFMQRMKRCATAFTNRGQIYRVAMTWDGGHEAEQFGGQFHVVILHDGHVELLGEQKSVVQHIRPKSGKPFTVNHKAWGVPNWLLEVAQYNDKSPQALAVDVFCMAFNTFVQSGVRDDNSVFVRIEKGKVAGMIAVPLSRCPQFFKDRGLKAKAIDGKRKRIFHYVRPHQRQMANGSQSDVKGHYRGIRAFDWQGHDVRIVLPGNQSFLVSEGPGAMDEDTLTAAERSKTVGSEKLVSVIEEAMSQ